MPDNSAKGSYTYPNTSDDRDRIDVLRNKFGIQSHKQLREEEYRATGGRMAKLYEGGGPSGNFDKEHLKAIHRYIFQDVYEWAGHTRDESPVVDGKRVEPVGGMQKGETVFLHGSRIQMGLDEALKPISDPTILRGSSTLEFSQRAGAVLGELNYVHPFREGNGRTQEAFIAELGRAYGHEVDFTVISKARMVEASREATENPASPAMSHLVLDATDPNRREALRMAFDALEKHGEKPMEHDIRTAQAGVQISGQVLADTNLAVTLVTDRGIVVADRADLPDRLPEDDDVTFTARSDFSRHSQAREYLATTRSEAAQNPELRAATTFEAYIERKLRDQYRDDPVAVARGLETARDRIAGMIARGAEFPTPQIKQTREHEQAPDPSRDPPQERER